MIDFPLHKMDTHFLSNIAWHTMSHIFPMESNVMCANHGKIFPLGAATEGWGNAILNDMDDSMRPLLGSPKVMGGWRGVEGSSRSRGSRGSMESRGSKRSKRPRG